MSMTTCPECKGNISSEALYCPHCGYPINANCSEATYELVKGKPGESGFASFLAVLAVLTWIGGLIIAIAGANVTKISSYGYSSSEFSFATFLTLFVPFVIYGAILQSMSTIVRQIAETHGIVQGMQLVRKIDERKHRESPRLTEKKTKPTEEQLAKVSDSPRAAGWQIDSGFAICPKCGIKNGIDALHNKGKCLGCGFVFFESDGSGTDDYGWVYDTDPQYVLCPNCGERFSRDYMKFRDACPKCKYAHVKND